MQPELHKIFCRSATVRDCVLCEGDAMRVYLVVRDLGGKSKERFVRKTDLGIGNIFWVICKKSLLFEYLISNLTPGLWFSRNYL